MNREIIFRKWSRNTDGEFRMKSVDYLGELDDRPYDSVYMQYTNLRDKHNKPIFEGDIVRYSPNPESIGNVYEIEFKNGGYRMGGWYLPGTFSRARNLMFDLEVIGNIFQPPEESCLECTKKLNNLDKPF